MRTQQRRRNIAWKRFKSKSVCALLLVLAGGSSCHRRKAYTFLSFLFSKCVCMYSHVQVPK